MHVQLPLLMYCVSTLIWYTSTCGVVPLQTQTCLQALWGPTHTRGVLEESVWIEGERERERQRQTEKGHILDKAQCLQYKLV